MIDWRTDEEAEAEVLWSEPEPPPHRSLTAVLRQQWRLWLAGLLVVAGVVAVITLHLIQRIETLNQTNRAAVEQAYWLTQTAVSAQDDDLYGVLLDPTNRPWRLLQQLFLREGLIWDRAPLGVWRDPSVAHTAVPTYITLSPDYQQAEVTTIQPYVAATAAGELKPIRLRQTAVFTRLNDQWVQASPTTSPDFWGPQLRNRVDSPLELIYPRRDQLIGQRLTVDLSQMVNQLCADPDVACPANLRIQLLLVDTDDALLFLAQDVYRVDANRFGVETGPYYQIVLPTPSLVGYPMDESSYDALSRGYAGWLMTVLLTHLATPPLTPELIAQKLRGFDLAPPPVVGYAPLASAPAALPTADLLVYCQSAEEEPLWQVAVEAEPAWVAFDGEWPTIEKRPFQPNLPVGVTLAQIQAAIPVNERPLSVRVIDAQWEASNRRWTVWVVADPLTDRQYLLTLEPPGQSVNFVRTVRTTGSTPAKMGLHQNGRFLSLENQQYGRSTLHLFAWPSGERVHAVGLGTAPVGDRFLWSPDEQWLLAMDSRAIRFFNPTTETRWVMYHNRTDCLSARWLAAP